MANCQSVICSHGYTGIPVISQLLLHSLSASSSFLAALVSLATAQLLKKDKILNHSSCREGEAVRQAWELDNSFVTVRPQCQFKGAQLRISFCSLGSVRRTGGISRLFIFPCLDIPGGGVYHLGISIWKWKQPRLCLTHIKYFPDVVSISGATVQYIEVWAPLSEVTTLHLQTCVTLYIIHPKKPNWQHPSTSLRTSVCTIPGCRQFAVTPEPVKISRLNRLNIYPHEQCDILAAANCGYTICVN